jgi:hypothetical protein
VEPGSSRELRDWLSCGELHSLASREFLHGLLILADIDSGRLALRAVNLLPLGTGSVGMYRTECSEFSCGSFTLDRPRQYIWP